jgi:hypothetical protein
VGSEPGLAGVDSLVWVEPDGPLEPGAPLPSLQVRVRSSAVLAAGRYLGGGWAVLAALGGVVPRVVRDALYDRFARNRHRISARSEACLLPTPEERARFLDGPDAGP